MQALVTIVTPTHNRALMISRAIESVLRQTYSNWEMLIVDDGSSDETAAVVKSYQDKDQRIRYIFKAQRAGACMARNTGIEQSKGEYITFLDSDDEYHPRKIELQVMCLQQSNVPDVGIVSCGREDYRNGVKYHEWVPRFKGNIINHLLKKVRVGANTSFLMVKKSILFDHHIFFDPEMPAGQDWDFLIRVCEKAGFDFVPQPLVIIHHHNGERVYTSDRALIAIEKQYHKYKNLLLQNKKIHDSFILKMAVQNYVYGRADKAVQILKSRVLNKSFKTSLWENCIKAFPTYGSLPSKVVHKLLVTVF